MKKLLVVLLVLTFMLGSISIFQSKQVLSHTESKIYHCAAEPWSWWYHSGKGGSGASGGANRGIADPTNYSVTKHCSNSSVQATSYQREHRNITKQRNQSLGWWWKFPLFWQMILNK
jgi:hypothetical protein